MMAWHARVRCCVACSLLGFAVLCVAQSEPQARMARVSLLVGSVDAKINDDYTWSPAMLNLPLGSASRIRTGPQSRAEVRIGPVSVQLDADSMLALRSVNDNSLSFVLHRGAASLHAPALAAGQSISVITGPVPVQARFAFVMGSPGQGPGRFHFAHRDAGSLFDVEVFEGQGEMTGITPTLPMPAGRRFVVNTTERSVSDTGEARESPFTEWARQRGRRSPQASTLRHISAEMTGAEELDQHGRWVSDPRWGALWLPAGVDAEWAPYRQGRWINTPRHGWAWVDDAPWGFAPFHYGRWLFNAGRWAWSPGARVEKPIYAAALVGFYDSGSSQPAWIGWFPLAPGEAYRPAFKATPEFVQSMNAPAFERLVSDGYRYANTLFAATALPREAFLTGQPTESSLLRLTPAMLALAGVLERHAPPVAATTSAPALSRP